MKATIFIFLVKMFGRFLPRRLLNSLLVAKKEEFCVCLLELLESASQGLILNVNSSCGGIFSAPYKEAIERVRVCKSTYNLLMEKLPSCSQGFSNQARCRLINIDWRIDFANQCLAEDLRH